MLANYYTLLHVARDLDERLVGKQLLEVFSQNKNELVLQFGRDNVVIVSCEPSVNFIVHRPSFARARKNSLNFFQPLINSTVRSVSLSMVDREVIFRTDSKQSLIVQMFGSKANVLLVTTDYSISQSFLRPQEFASKTYSPRQTGYQGFSNEQDFRSAVSSYGDTLLGTALKKLLPQFGNELVQELMSRARVDPNTRTSETYFADLFHAYVNLLSNLTASPSPGIYFEGSRPTMFSLVPLHRFDNLQWKSFESIHEAIRAFTAGQQRNKQFDEQASDIRAVLEREIKRGERILQKLSLEMDSEHRAEQFETRGKLIIANLRTIRKGMKEVEVENTFEKPPSSVVISLDPSLTATENAERYFQKSKAARTSREENLQRKETLARRTRTAQELLAELENLESAETLQYFVQERKDDLADFGIHPGKRPGQLKEEQVPFRVFTVEGGFQVWVGKSSENNDVLTMKHAKPNDLWFHARGASGSHVVLKIGSGKGEPGKRALEQAASIAAYYSKMKKSSLVPVAMTQKKYVRKPRRAPAGTVTIEREKILFVEPRLPATL